MARGGYRAGAGRRKGAPNTKIAKKEEKIIRQSAVASKMSPLEYMLSVMNDSGNEPDRRDKMAIAAAPYVHERAAEKKLGKKEQQVENAKNANLRHLVQRGSPKIVVNNR